MPTEYGNILTVILENFAKLLPVRTVHEYQQGLRWTIGRAGKNLNPGWKFFFPLLQSIDVLDITASSIDLQPQVIQTKDDKQCVVRSGLEYRIVSARDYFLQLQDNDAIPTIRIVARGYIASELSRYNFSDIWDRKEDIEKVLTDTLQNKLKHWGLDAHRIHIAEFSPVRSLRFFGINDGITPGTTETM